MSGSPDSSLAQPTPDQPQAAPTARGERIESLDFIRGLAVMGIVLANIVIFGQPLTAATWPGGFLVPDGDPDGWMWIAQFVLIDGKMRGLFTLLFGAGLMLFMEKAWARGATRSLQVRRLAWLLAFGLLHFFLLWQGDILTLYALCGLAALACVRWEMEKQIAAALVAYVAGAVLWSAMLYYFYLIAETPFGEAPMMAEVRAGALAARSVPIADAAIETALMRDGSWLANVSHRIDAHGLDWLTGLRQVAWETIPLMLLGMGLYRAGLFDGRLDPRKQRIWGWAGLLGGAVATLLLALWVQAKGFTYFSTLYAFVGPSMMTRLPMILGLAALLALRAPGATGWLGQRIVATGRMAFSNYLGTSFVMLFVFSGWALDLFGRLDRAQLYFVALLGWAIMLTWSQPWLARFRYGPLEWLWRCLTYGRLFPLRR